MAFDLESAKPIEAGSGGGFDLASAKPVGADAVQTAMDRSPMAGIVDTAGSLLSGAVAAPVAGLAGLAGAVLPGEPGQGARTVERVQDALTYQPRTKMGKAVTGAISAPFEALAHGADKAGSSVAEKTGSPAVGAAVNTAIQSIPMVIGKAAGKAGPIKSAAEKDPRTYANVQKAREAGYSLTPDDAGAGPISKTLAGLSGEPKLAKSISKKNQDVHNALIAEDLGLPKGTELDRPTIAKVRTEAGKVYEEVRQLGRVETGPEYGAALQKIVETSEGAEASFPTGRKHPAYELVESLNQPSFTASAGVDKIKLLRKDADEAYRKGDTMMGKAYRQGALAIEDALDRHLQQLAAQPAAPGVGPAQITKAPGTSVARAGEAARIEKDITPGAETQQPRVTSDLLTRFRDARQRIAKSYAADKALNSETGNINPQVYAAMLDKGKVSGPGRQVAEFAKAFPRSAQKTDRLGSTSPTIFDAALAMGAHKWPVALARHGTREAIASKPGQTLIRPKDWSAAELARQIQGAPGVGALETAEGQRDRR